jgi:hypothetical protein
MDRLQRERARQPLSLTPPSARCPMQQLNRCHGLIGLTVVDIPTTRATDNRLNDIDSLKMVNIYPK